MLASGGILRERDLSTSSKMIFLEHFYQSQIVWVIWLEMLWPIT